MFSLQDTLPGFSNHNKPSSPKLIIFSFLKSRSNDLRPVDSSPPLIVNLFEESLPKKRSSPDIWRSPGQELSPREQSLRDDSVRELREETWSLRSQLNEKKNTWEQSNTKLENVLMEIKSTLQEMKLRELQTNAGMHSSKVHINQLMTIIARNEREDRWRRRLNILVYGLMSPDEDMTSKASDFIEQYFNLKNCVTSARALGNNKNILVIQLKDAQAKAQIQKNVAVLKDTGIRIRPDLTLEQRLVHRRLKEIGLEALKQGRIVRFGYMWIEIDYVRYYWNNRTNSLQQSL